jgi:hypothetical protein
MYIAGTSNQGSISWKELYKCSINPSAETGTRHPIANTATNIKITEHSIRI